MKKGLFFALLVLTPLFTYSSPHRHQDVFGVWEDYRSGLLLQIKPGKRRSILVKPLNNRHRARWVRYDRIRRGFYDDCNGSTIRLTRNGLRWSKRHGRRTFYLEKTYLGRDGRRDFYREGYDDYDRWYRPRNRNRSFGYSNLSGNWYCSAHNINIDVVFRDDRIRVRRYNNRRNRYDDWYEYRRDRNNRSRFYGNNGKYYDVYDDQLIFRDDRRDIKLSFKRQRR